MLLRVVLTLLLALAGAQACLALHTPLPWMIGPLLATATASMAGLPTASAAPLRHAAQWTIGATLGLYFTPQVGALVAGLWWAVLLAVAWALGMGALFGLALQRLHAKRMALPPPVLRATTWFSGAIGAASEMTLLAERAGARTDLVAASHSLRLVIVTLLVPFALQWAGLHGLDAVSPAVRDVRPAGFVLLAAGTGAGALVAVALRRANPWFLGALLVAMAVTLCGLTLSAVPQWMSNAAQLVIGASLGVRFSGGFLRKAPWWLVTVAAGTLVLVVLSALFGWGLAGLAGLPVATVLLGTAPGGIAEMSITAKVLQLGVPVVTAFQVCRLLAVLMLVEPLYRWCYTRHDLRA